MTWSNISNKGIEIDHIGRSKVKVHSMLLDQVTVYMTSEMTQSLDLNLNETDR